MLTKKTVFSSNYLFKMLQFLLPCTRSSNQLQRMSFNVFQNASELSIHKKRSYIKHNNMRSR